MDVFILDVADYTSPECTCNVENTVAKLDHVVGVEFNPPTQVLKVTAHQGRITRGALIKHLQDCWVRCSDDASDGMTCEHGAQGMDKAAHSPGHDHHAMMEMDFRRRFIISSAITAPVLLLSPTIQGWFGFTIPRFPGYDMILFLLASAIAFYGGIPFYKGAAASLRRGVLGMMVLVSLAVAAGYLFSVVSTFVFADAVDFYWEISTLVVLLLFGHWMEMRMTRRASGALRELAKLIPPWPTS